MTGLTASCPRCSGFEREDSWGYRALEPNRCCIASIALVLLKTGITHGTTTKAASNAGSDPASPTSESGLTTTSSSEDANAAATGGVQVDAQQLATAQKLLLFWRKPAVRRDGSPFQCGFFFFLVADILRPGVVQRKCWWDATDVVLHPGTPKEQSLKVWARRVWTLELSLI